MRISAGALRGRVVRVPDIAGLRPTPAKVRQALFNILGSVDGWRMLDLFAGSGVMALEALSRGAEAVVSVEQHAKAVQAMRLLQREFDLTGWTIMRQPVERGLSSLRGEHFDLVYADPPYDSGMAAKLPQWLDEAGIGCGMLVIEEAARQQPGWPAGWLCRQSRRYGDTCLHFLQRGDSSFE